MEHGLAVKYEDLLVDTKGTMIALLKALGHNPDEGFAEKVGCLGPDFVFYLNELLEVKLNHQNVRFGS